MTASDPWRLSVAQAAALIAAKRLSPVELVQDYLDRIERLNEVLRAWPCCTDRSFGGEEWTV
jgi:Asp-tRNA(Asn)/Glu-tRNA(Gln) amidotransferase A subunit family amidase